MSEWKITYRRIVYPWHCVPMGHMAAVEQHTQYKRELHALRCNRHCWK